MRICFRFRIYYFLLIATHKTFIRFLITTFSQRLTNGELSSPIDLAYEESIHHGTVKMNKNNDQVQTETSKKRVAVEKCEQLHFINTTSSYFRLTSKDQVFHKSNWLQSIAIYSSCERA